MQPKYYSTADIARAMGVTVGTVRAWAAAGHLPSTRVGPGGRLRFPAAAVKEAIGLKIGQTAAK